MNRDIEKNTGDNLGGINAFKFCFAEEVSEVPPVLNGAVRTAVVLNTGCRWYDGYCTEFTMEFKDDQQNSDHGTYHVKEFNGFIPKDRSELVDLFNTISNRKFILHLTYNNGCHKLIGNVNEPLYMVAPQQSGKGMGDKQGHNITFKGEGIFKSPFYII